MEPTGTKQQSRVLWSGQLSRTDQVPAQTPEERRLRAFVAATSDIVWTAGPRGDASVVSQAWMLATGQSVAETQGWGWMDAIHPDDQARVKTEWLQAIERRQPWSIELRLRHSRVGGARLIQSRIVPVFDEESGELIEWIGTFQDITAARRAESLLAQQNQILELIARGAPLGVILERLTRSIEIHVEGLLCTVRLLRDGRLWNGAAPSMPPEYVRGTEGVPIDQDSGCCGTAVSSDTSIRVEDIASDPVWRGDRKPALRLGLRSCWSTPIRLGTGEILGTFAMYHGQLYRPDGSEEDLVKVGTHLASIAIERHRDRETLRKRSEELAEAHRRKDEFLALLGHELRNPLAAIVNATQLIENVQGDPKLLSFASGVLLRQSGALSRLVDDLLDVSRITRGKILLKRAVVAVQSVVHTAAETAGPLIIERHHDLTIETPTEPLLVDVDSVRIAQAVSNLLSNAAKYTPPGGRIRIAVQSSLGKVFISVQDTGPGLSSEALSEVFDLFVQAHESVDQSRGGLGIGLTVVRRLVEMHDGRVWANSRGVGQGCEFVIELPLYGGEVGSTCAPGSPAEELPDASPLRHRARVLIVDDNADLAEVLAEAINRAGYDVRTASDGPSALVALEDCSPDVILLDIGLPGMDGYEVARRIRLALKGRSVRMLALTGYGQAEDRARALASGFDEHLTKPLDLSALLALLHQDSGIRQDSCEVGR